jgi:anti-sigma factor RsiW
VKTLVSEQDRTDYALNELDPHQRMYVESMLAASEECRHDIVKMIEMAQLLEDGFEREGITARRTEFTLLPEQRAELTRPHHTMRYAVRDVISALGLAATVAFALTHFDKPQFQPARDAAGRMAEASTKAAGVMTAAVQSPEKIDLAKALASLRELAEESSKLIPATNETLDAGGASATICTPPTLIMESAQFAGFAEIK